MNLKAFVMTLSMLATPVAALAEVPAGDADAQRLQRLAGFVERAKAGEPKKSEVTEGAPVAAALTSSEKLETEDPIQSITTMFGAAFGIAALFVGGAFVMKRLKSKGMFDAANNELRLEESLWVGKGQRLLLVSVGERRVLLGVTGAGFEGLAVLDQEVEPARGLSSDHPALSVVQAKPRIEEPAEERPKRKFAEVLSEEDVFKPSPSDRRRIIQRLNTL
ncbi:MAG: flagellar biosynthetic protein FliO [Deltaproteobacteria bacterium]